MGRNKGKAATEKDRNFAFSDEMKKKGAHTGREKGRGGVETTSRGTSTVAPKATKRYCTPANALRVGLRVTEEEDMNEGTNFIFPLQK